MARQRRGDESRCCPDIPAGADIRVVVTVDIPVGGGVVVGVVVNVGNPAVVDIVVVVADRNGRHLRRRRRTCQNAEFAREGNTAPEDGLS